MASVLWSGGVQAQLQSLDRVVAIVDNDVIMHSQLDARMVEVRQTLSKRGNALPPEHVLQQQVLERLIIENIQLQIGDRSGIRIADDELNGAIGSIAQRNGMSLAQFRQALTNDGLSYDEARDQVRREMIISRVREYRVSDRIQISDQEVTNFLSSDLGQIQLAEELRLALIFLPLPEGSSPEQIRASEAAADDLYRQIQNGADFAQLAIARSAGENALEGGEIGWRKAAQLPGVFSELAPKLAVGETTQPVRMPGGFYLVKVLEKRGGEVNALVDEVRARHILIKPSAIRSEQDAEKQAERLYQRIMNGEDFAKLAKNFSEDPGSALSGGDLNWVSPDAMVPEFRAQMQQTAVNEVSKPFRTQFGWHVLRVEGRRATDRSEALREHQARTALRNRKYDEELALWLRQIRDEAFVEIKL
nr:peptidylprolyl isomerase [Atopomonas sediminilitoris]